MGQVSKPLVPPGPVREFYDRLHLLHAAAGRPSMRELQRRTRCRARPSGINPTTIHDALTSPRLAGWETVRALVEALGAAPAEFSVLWRLARADLALGGGDPGDGRPVPPRPAAHPPHDRPLRQLPPRVWPFVGRRAELAELDALLAAAAPAPTLVAIPGTAGVGKSALAVHWGHQIADRFPGGHLYLDLRGYDPDPPLSAAEALGVLLRALGLPDSEVPPGVAERSARYRSLLAGQRLLVVLDNARDADQVRPLLPGMPGCVVVVTSRDSLAGLVARHGAYRLRLMPLRAPDATSLLEALIGAAGAHGRLADLAAGCDGLPLALRIAAELAGGRFADGLDDLLAELSNERRRMGLFDAGADPRTALHAVFSWSYRHLPADAARAFRLLSLHRADVDPHVAAALFGTGPDTARRLLDTLAHAHLLDRTPGGYRMSTLLGTYASGLCWRLDDEGERRAALHRLGRRASGDRLALAAAED